MNQNQISIKIIKDDYLLENYFSSFNQNIDFRFNKTDVLNNTNNFSTNPVIIYKKKPKTREGNENKPENINNYISDGGLKKKLDRFKIYPTNPTNQTNPTLTKINKNQKESKTERASGIKFNLKKKEKYMKFGKKNKDREKDKEQKEREKEKEREREKEKEKEKNKNNKEKEKVKTLRRDLNLEKEKERNEEVSKNREKDKGKKEKDINAVLNNKINYKKDNQQKINDECKEQEKKKIEFINILIKNSISNAAREFELLKKLTPKQVMTKRKKEYLEENGINFIKAKKGHLSPHNDDSKGNKSHQQFNVNVKSLGKAHLNIGNHSRVYKGTKSKNAEKHNNNKTLSRYLSYNSNCEEISSLINNNSAEREGNKKNKIIFKPRVCQFEYLNKIYKEQKKLLNHFEENEEKNKNINIQNDNNNSFKAINDSFRHRGGDFFIDGNIQYLDNKKRRITCMKIKKESKQKIFEDNDDEFPFSHRKSYRSPEEISKFLKEKRMKTYKKEEDNEKEKKMRAFLTFQNLCNIGKNYIKPIIPNKNKKENKEKMKLNKLPNEYYVGTESSRNSSTFIDKNEFYISIIESKKFVSNSKTSKTKDEKYFNIKIYDKDLKEINQSKEKKEYIEKEEDTTSSGCNNKNISNKKILKVYSEAVLYDKKINELNKKVNNNRRKTKALFSKKNLEKIKAFLNLTNNKKKCNEDNVHKPINCIKSNINSKKLKSKGEYKKKPSEIKIEIANTQDNKVGEIKPESPTGENTKENNLPSLSHTYSNNTNPNKKLEIEIEPRIVLNLFNIIKIVITRRIFFFLLEIYFKEFEIKRLQIGFDFIIAICKFYSFKKIEGYNHAKEYYFSIVRLIKPFLHIKYKIFLKNCKCFIKIKKFIGILTKFLRIGIFSKLFRYYSKDLREKNNLSLFDFIMRPFIKKAFNKIKYYSNINEKSSKKIILRMGINKELEKIKKMEDCNSINSQSDLPLHIENSNDNLIIHNNKFNKNDDYDMQITEEILNKVTENNQSSTEIDQNNVYIYLNENKRENNNFYIDNLLYENTSRSKEELIRTMIQNNLLNNSTSIVISGKYSDSETNCFQNNRINSDFLSLYPKQVLKFKEINNLDKFTDELADKIIFSLISLEFNENGDKILPTKTFKYEANLSSNESLSQSLTSSYIYEENLASEQSSIVNSTNRQILNESMKSQLSFFSEFNKTVQEKKEEVSLKLYAESIAPKLIKIICDEINSKYPRIYENISTPLKSDYEELVVAFSLKNNDILRNNYRILKTREELRNIIDRNKILMKFQPINQRIRSKNNCDISKFHFYDSLLNECLIDTAIELISNERFYGEMGEPFPFSYRTRELIFKYDKKNPKKLVKHIFSSLLEYLCNPIFLIKDNTINITEERLIRCFKKELEESDYQSQWDELEIVETQLKLETTEVIMDQLYNEIVEILEHVQLNRKKPELYQYKSIYACEDIPKLSFQQTTTENETIGDYE